MNGNQEALAAGIAGASVTMLLVFYVAVIVLLIIARWRIFTKAGEKGWKSIIPIYADYVQWRIGWKKTGLFWLSIVLVVGGVGFALATGAYAVNSAGDLVVTGANNTVAMIGFALVIIGGILNLISVYKLFASFGHGVGWFIGYILVPNIMMLVLGFGSSRYLGPRN